MKERKKNTYRARPRKERRKNPGIYEEERGITRKSGKRERQAYEQKRRVYKEFSISISIAAPGLPRTGSLSHSLSGGRSWRPLAS